MNCANHADASAVAYCRNCGKALCANCTRPVRGVIYCEDCLGAKMEGTAGAPAAAAAPPPTGYQQFMEQGLGMKVAPGPVSGPNPTVAGILAGFFPFGVGAVYTGQYAKGLAHLIIVASLFAGAIASGNRNSDGLTAICVLSLIFFYVYQIIDSVRSAKAIQMAQPVPDPFGLASTFGGGAKIETSKIPMGAIVLILLGVLFLLNTLGLTEYGLDRFWPLILIFLGGWL
ncbi:MAG: B-box zinc finger protein, partial [Terriglobales bacterium]